jgi:hypothetical protein
LEFFTDSLKLCFDKRRDSFRSQLRRLFVHSVRNNEYGKFDDLWQEAKQGNFFHLVKDGVIYHWRSHLLAAIIHTCFLPSKSSVSSVALYLPSGRFPHETLAAAASGVSVVIIIYYLSRSQLLQAAYVLFLARQAYVKESGGFEDRIDPIGIWEIEYNLTSHKYWDKWMVPVFKYCMDEAFGTPVPLDIDIYWQQYVI